MALQLKKFGVFCSRVVGELVKAKDIHDLLENRLSKRLSEHWSSIQFKDEEGRTITIFRGHLDDFENNVEKTIQDFITFSSQDEFEETISVLNPNGSGTIEIED